MASLITAADYFAADELTDASSADRTRLYKALADGRSSWACHLCKMLGDKAPPSAVGVRKAPPRKEVDIPAAIKPSRMPRRIGEMLRALQVAANLFPGALREWSEACPPYVPFLTPKAGEAPRAP